MKVENDSFNFNIFTMDPKIYTMWYEKCKKKILHFSGKSFRFKVEPYTLRSMPPQFVLNNRIESIAQNRFSFLPTSLFISNLSPASHLEFPVIFRETKSGKYGEIEHNRRPTP